MRTQCVCLTRSGNSVKMDDLREEIAMRDGARTGRVTENIAPPAHSLLVALPWARISPRDVPNGGAAVHFKIERERET